MVTSTWSSMARSEIPSTNLQVLKDIGRPHVDSFNFILEGGLRSAVKDIPAIEFQTPRGDVIKIKFEKAEISNPINKDRLLYPAECRQRKTTYKGLIAVRLVWFKNGAKQEQIDKGLGEIPIMLMSKVCNLANFSPKQMIKHGEDAKEFGGYFIVNGIEKILRMLIVPRRNYPLANVKQSWKQRGKLFSEFGVSIRCVHQEHAATNMVLHYLTNGTCKLMFFYRKEMFFVPVVLILKALCDEPDYSIYKQLIRGKENDSFYTNCVKNMLREAANAGLGKPEDVREFLGDKFRVKLPIPESYSNSQATEFLLQQCICIHLEDNKNKFDLLAFMTRKLFTLAKGECAAESPDNPMNQEILLGGSLYLLVLKDKLSNWLQNLKMLIEKKLSTAGPRFNLQQNDIIFAVNRVSDLSKSLEYLLSTGNFNSRSGMGMLQTTGLAVVLDKINYLRFLAHFQAVHRGAVFTEMRTTSVRKLRPEAWGFICPVHTPDGTPCGLLNHLAEKCSIVTEVSSWSDPKKYLATLNSLGMRQDLVDFEQSYPILLDGNLIGWVRDDDAEQFCRELRQLKVLQEHVPPTLEIALVPKTNRPSIYPGIFLFSTPARMMREVNYTKPRLHRRELIGVFEQVYIGGVCITKDDLKKWEEEEKLLWEQRMRKYGLSEKRKDEYKDKIPTHLEVKKTNVLSLLANLVPYSNYNQSPRNMYQCQMAKQTMGTPSHALITKPDTKVYKLQTPQSPLVKPLMYDEYELDDYATGTNAIVAVISYTGYDMEDAMVINKASIQRGFAHGTIYKSEFIDLTAKDRGTNNEYFFKLKPDDKRAASKIDLDGLPFIGTHLKIGDPFYSFQNQRSGDFTVVYYKSQEEAYVDTVRALGDEKDSNLVQQVHITLRIKRAPDVGDKFANRHGQKGVCSMRYPQEDLPFTESGMIPDITFNPHGFPSRMTVGMLIEAMAGKAAASEGVRYDATPFMHDQDSSVIDYVGECLQNAGFNYYGTEKMYSGIDGEELEADVFIGVIYYQRLRHMVADKFQVRSTGPIDVVTHQPIKGRKRGGGIRFGEMERDSLIAHGTSYLLQDRLFHCSDGSIEHVCIKCGSILSPLMQLPAFGDDRNDPREWICKTCGSKKDVKTIAIPHVLKYLFCELAAINIKVILEIKRPH